MFPALVRRRWNRDNKNKVTMASEVSSKTLRVAGLGHLLTLQLSSQTTIGGLKQEIEQNTGIPAFYQRLLARGSKLDCNEITLEEAKIKDRTRIMLLHNELYGQEKEGFEALEAVSREIEDLARKKESTSPTVLTELVTRLCCRLDGIDTAGSSNLRRKRKDLIRKAENLDSSKSADDIS